MKSYRIQHYTPAEPQSQSEDGETYAYKSHASEDRENMLEVQKVGWEPPEWLDVSRQVITPLCFIAQLITSEFPIRSCGFVIGSESVKYRPGDLNQISRTGEGIAGAFALDSDAATALEPSPTWFCIWRVLDPHNENSRTTRSRTLVA